VAVRRRWKDLLVSTLLASVLEAIIAWRGPLIGEALVLSEPEAWRSGAISLPRERALGADEEQKAQRLRFEWTGDLHRTLAGARGVRVRSQYSGASNLPGLPFDVEDHGKIDALVNGLVVDGPVESCLCDSQGISLDFYNAGVRIATVTYNQLGIQWRPRCALVT
jgi:hypothetical protein